nr:MAG TPA: hypothetical protein [Caudoviricetes sp.]DAS74509.1 MAG TPA: hypothetical protein [Caudoviricetes sp.]
MSYKDTLRHPKLAFCGLFYCTKFTDNQCKTMARQITA